MNTAQQQRAKYMIEELKIDPELVAESFGVDVSELQFNAVDSAPTTEEE